MCRCQHRNSRTRWPCGCCVRLFFMYQSLSFFSVGFSGSSAASSTMSVTSCWKSNAFFSVITGLPVSASRACRAIPATLPPRLATCLFSSKVCGFAVLEISVVDASASMVSTSSKSVMLSRRFSFVRPFSRLYCPVVMPDHAREISSVRMAYSLPFCTPRFFHSSVSSLRMRIAKSRW